MNARPNAYIAATKPDKVKDDGIQPIFDFIKSWFKKPEPAFEPTLDLTAARWEAMPEAIHDNDVYLLNTEDGKYQIGEIYGAKNAQLVVHSPEMLKSFRSLTISSLLALEYSKGKIKNSIWYDMKFATSNALGILRDIKGEDYVKELAKLYDQL